MYLGWHREQQANVAKQLRDLEPSTTACRLPPVVCFAYSKRGETQSVAVLGALCKFSWPSASLYPSLAMRHQPHLMEFLIN